MSDDSYNFPKKHIKEIEKQIESFNKTVGEDQTINKIDNQISYEINENIVIYENILENAESNKENINEIYNNLIGLYKKEAKEYGYTYYLDYHNYINGNREYDPKKHKDIEDSIIYYSDELKNFYDTYSKQVGGLHPYDLNKARIANKSNNVDIYKDIISPLKKLDIDFFNYIYNLYKDGYIVVQHNNLIQEAFFLDLPFSKKVFIYANLTEDLDDYFYLVHEIGHAYHSYLNKLNGVSDSSLELKEYMAHSFESIFIKNNCDKELIDIYRVQTISSFLWEVVLYEYQETIYNDNLKYKNLFDKNKLFLNIIKKRTHKIYSDTILYDNSLDYMWMYETSLFKSPFYNFEYIYSKKHIIERLDGIYNIDLLYEDYIKLIDK